MSVSPPAEASHQLLVVDDEPELRQLLAEYFGRHGFAVRQAGDAAAARLLIAQALPALAILDINMPGENGLSLARWLVTPAARAVIGVIVSVRRRQCSADRNAKPSPLWGD